MNDNQESPGFLNRWSARKQQAADEKSTGRMLPTDECLSDSLPQQPVSELPEPLTSSDPQSAEQNPRSESNSVALEASEAGESSDVPQLTDADMPPIESLSSESDISGFFSKGVSAELKKAALRHVFLLPEYNVRDGLNDYDGDYTYFEPLGDTITSDMKWHTARKERDRLEAEAAEREALEQQQAELQDDDEQDTAESESAEQQEQDEAQRIDESHPAIDEEVPNDEFDEQQLAEQLAFASDSTPGSSPESLSSQSRRVGGGKLTRVREGQIEKEKPSQQLDNTDRLSKTNARENDE